MSTQHQPMKRKMTITNASSGVDDHSECKNSAMPMKKRKLNKKNQEHVEKFTPTIINCGQEYRIGDTCFIMNDPKMSLHLMKMSDYNIITNAPFTQDDLALIPIALKPLLEPRWYYALHVSYGMAVSINRSILRARVSGGEILAYKYAECSIEGNECVYYGFIPTIVPKISKSDANDSNGKKKRRQRRQQINTTQQSSSTTVSSEVSSTLTNPSNNTAPFEGTHRTCRISTNAIWSRKLYIHLTREYICDCSKNCWYWSVRLNDYHTVQRYCFKRIPWQNLYVIMGENDTECLEQLKIARTCVVCAQCFDCANSPVFCRRHKTCKHKRAIFFEDSTTSTTVVPPPPTHSSSPTAMDNDTTTTTALPPKHPTLISDSKIKSCVKF